MGPYELQAHAPRRKASRGAWPTTSGVRVMTALPNIPRLYTALPNVWLWVSTPCRWRIRFAKRPPSLLKVRHGRWPRVLQAATLAAFCWRVILAWRQLCGDAVFILLGHLAPSPAGSGYVCALPGSFWPMAPVPAAAALASLASAQRGRRPVTAASGAVYGGV